MLPAQRINTLLQMWSQKAGESFVQNADFPQQARIVLTASEYALHYFEGDPERMIPLLEQGALQQRPLPDEFTALLEEKLAHVDDEEQLHHELRLFRSRYRTSSDSPSLPGVDEQHQWRGAWEFLSDFWIRFDQKG